MKNSLTVAFVADHPWERVAKLALGLRKIGVSVILLHTKQTYFDPRLYFDFAIKCLNAEQCLTIARRLNADVFHVFSRSADDTALAIMDGLNAKKVFDYKDLFENLIAHPINEPLWKAQRFLIDRASGLCCRDKVMEQYLRVNNITPNGKMTLFPDYCYGINQELKPTNKETTEVHLTLSGTFIPEQLLPEYASAGYILVAEEFIRKKIHFHIHPTNWAQKSLAKIASTTGDTDYHKLARKSSYFHLHQTMSLEQLLPTIAGYDFGIVLLQGPFFDMKENYALNDAHKFGASTRMFDYIEAGIDVLMHDIFEYQAEFLGKYNFGAVVDKTFFFDDHLREKLLDMKNDRNRQEALKEARTKLSIENHTPKLVEFYQSL